MKPLPFRVVPATLLVAASCLVLIVPTARVTAAEAVPSLLLRQLQSLTFTPPDDPSFQQATAALLAAIGRLQQSSDATDREQLQWLGIPEHSDQSPQSDRLARLLDDDKQLRQLQIQLEQDFAPFEQPRYQQLRDAVERYRRMRHARGTSDLRQKFDQHHSWLTESLSQWVATREEPLYEPLRGHVLWLEEHLQGEELVGQLRRELSHPNLILHLPADALAQVSRRTISQSDPFSQRTRQMQTSGTSRFDGSVQLLPRVGENPLQLDCPGTVQLATQSHLGRFRFNSQATTQVHGQLDLDVTEQGFRIVAAPTVDARTQLRVGHVHARRSGPLPRLAGRVVDGAIARRTDQAANQISSTVRDRLRGEIERLAADQLERINASFQQRIADPATRLLMWPRQWQVSANERAVTLKLTEDRHCGLAAPSDWPVNGDGTVNGDLTVEKQSTSPSLAVHESFATDLLNALFRGQNWPRDLDANGLQSFNDQLPIPLFESRDFLPKTRLRVQLHARRPFHVRFTDHRICLVLRAERLVLDDVETKGGQLELAFRLSAEGEHLVLRRDGQPRLLLGDDPSITTELPGTTELARKLEAVCRDELLAAMKNEVTIPAVIETDGWSVRPDRLDARSGWFTLVARFGGNSP